LRDCEWEVISDKEEFEGFKYLRFLCSTCGAMSWELVGEWPEDCHEKD
jgi:hypothetical protein